MSRETNLQQGQTQNSQMQNSQMQNNQMNAAISGHSRVPSSDRAQAFGKIGIPAVAAAAEMLRAKKPAEKPIHASFYLGSD